MYFLAQKARNIFWIFTALRICFCLRTVAPNRARLTASTAANRIEGDNEDNIGCPSKPIMVPEVVVVVAPLLFINGNFNLELLLILLFESSPEDKFGEEGLSLLLKLPELPSFCKPGDDTEEVLVEDNVAAAAALTVKLFLRMIAPLLPLELIPMECNSSFPIPISANLTKDFLL